MTIYFGSGYETGDFSDFTCTSTTPPTAQQVIVYADAWAAQCGSTDAWNARFAAKTITFPTTYYVKARIRVDEWTVAIGAFPCQESDGLWGFFLGVDNPIACASDPYASTRCFAFGIRIISGATKLILYKGQDISYTDLGITLTLGQWYDVCIGIYNHASEGWVKIWIDRVLMCTLTSQDTDDMTRIFVGWSGAFMGSGCGDITTYNDAVMVDDVSPVPPAGAYTLMGTGSPCTIAHLLGWEENATRRIARKKVRRKCTATPRPAQAFISMPKIITIMFRANTSEKECIETLGASCHVVANQWVCCEAVNLYDEDGVFLHNVWIDNRHFRWDTGLGCGDRPWIITLTLVVL